jgi:hypothetical protein
MPFPIFVLLASGIAASTMAAVAFLTRRPWLAALAGITGATALLLVHGALYFDYYADDSYITLRYSKHLAEGLGPNWNSEGHVEGYTTFLWMGLLAGVGKLGFDLVDASRVLGFVALVATFLTVFLVGKLWRNEEPGGWLASPLLPTTAVLALSLHDGVSFWGFSGMETPLFTALLTASAYLYLRERRGGRVPWSAVALGATAMARPEGLLAVAVTGAFVVRDAARDTGLRQALARTLGWGAVFLALYGPYFVWRYDYYGYLFPNTYYAKVGLTSASLDRGLQYLASTGLQYQLLAMFAGLAVLATHPRLGRDALYVIALAGTMLAGIVVEGGGDAHGRFVVPLLPLLFLGGLAGFATLLERAGGPTRWAAVLTSLALALGGLSLLPSSNDPLLAVGGSAVAERGRLGAWFNEHTPLHYTIADFQIGAIAYYASDRDFLDLLGLNDVVIAHTEIPDMGRGIAGHEKYNVDYVLERVRPEIIVLGQVHERPFTAEELQPYIRASLLTRASAAILTDARLWDRYGVRALYLDGYWVHFLQRNDTIPELTALGLH